MCFQYDVQYRPGSQNAMADYLSHVPHLTSSSAADLVQDQFTEIAEISPLHAALPLAHFKAECDHYPALAKLQLVIISHIF